MKVTKQTFNSIFKKASLPLAKGLRNPFTDKILFPQNLAVPSDRSKVSVHSRLLTVLGSQTLTH